MFKKREVKGQLRKAKEDDSEDEDATENAIDGVIGDIKARQLHRKKVKYDFSEIPDADSGATKAHKPSEASKSIQAMMGSQFSVKVEDSGKFNAHEKIMEKYINEKLGLIDSTTGSERKDTALNKSTGGSDDNELGLLGTGVGAGLAEVELPMKYKLANIQETEAARQRLLDERAGKTKNAAATSSSSGGDLASFRYQKVHALPFIPRGFGRPNENRDSKDTSGDGPPAPIHPTVPLPGSSGDTGPDHTHKSTYYSKSGGTRTDDFMVQHFKKTQIQKR